MNFLNEMYEKEVAEELFTKSNRVTFQEFIDFLEKYSKHEYSSEQFETEMAVFDDDRNGEASFRDIHRVLKDYGNMDD